MQEYFKKNHLTIIVIILLVYIILNNFGHGSWNKSLIFSKNYNIFNINIITLLN